MKRFQILLLFFSSCLLYGQGQTIPGLSSRFLKVKENDVYSKAQQGDKKAQFLVGTFFIKQDSITREIRNRPSNGLPFQPNKITTKRN